MNTPTPTSIPTMAEPSAPFALLAVGSYERGGEAADITADDLATAVANFRDRPAEVPIDYDHSFARGGESRAAGWIADLQLDDDGIRLMARACWTAGAKQALADDEYRYISAEFSRSGTDETGEARGFTILAAALTNRPFLRSLGGVAFTVPAEDPGEPAESPDGELTAMAVLLGIEQRVASGEFNAEAEEWELRIAGAMHEDGMTYEQAAAATWKGA